MAQVIKYTSFTQVLQNVLKDEELAIYESFYHEIVQGSLAKKAAGHRHDLGSHVAQKKPEVENITQVNYGSVLSNLHCIKLHGVC